MMLNGTLYSYFVKFSSIFITLHFILHHIPLTLIYNIMIKCFSHTAKLQKLKHYIGTFYFFISDQMPKNDVQQIMIFSPMKLYLYTINMSVLCDMRMSEQYDHKCMITDVPTKVLIYVRKYCTHKAIIS